jgi:hypothetical protein
VRTCAVIVILSKAVCAPAFSNVIPDESDSAACERMTMSTK